MVDPVDIFQRQQSEQALESQLKSQRPLDVAKAVALGTLAGTALPVIMTGAPALLGELMAAPKGVASLQTQKALEHWLQAKLQVPAKNAKSMVAGLNLYLMGGTAHTPQIEQLYSILKSDAGILEPGRYTKDTKKIADHLQDVYRSAHPNALFKRPQVAHQLAWNFIKRVGPTLGIAAGVGGALGLGLSAGKALHDRREHNKLMARFREAQATEKTAAFSGISEFTLEACAEELLEQMEKDAGVRDLLGKIFKRAPKVPPRTVGPGGPLVEATKGKPISPELKKFLTASRKPYGMPSVGLGSVGSSFGRYP